MAEIERAPEYCQRCDVPMDRGYQADLCIVCECAVTDAMYAWEDRANRGLATVETDRKTGAFHDAAQMYPVYEQKLITEVLQEINEAVGPYFPGLEEGIHRFPVHDPTDRWPVGRIVVFACRGGSEGDYVHVEVQHRGGGKQDYADHLVLIGKTFNGRHGAWQAAKILADLLGA